MKRYNTLDGLRGVAAFAVVVGHSSRILGTPFWRTSTAMAVDFFFMLSGFVLLCAYRRRLEAVGSLKLYLMARVIRLQPLIVLSTLAAGVCTYFDTTRSAGLHALYVFEGSIPLPAFPFTEWSAPIMPINPPVWSLFLEYIASVASTLR